MANKNTTRNRAFAATANGGVVTTAATFERRSVSTSAFSVDEDIPILPDRPFVQQVLERLFAATVLIISWPLLVALAIIIKVDSPGPALFWQQRLGRGAKPFRFVKFRTLYADARERWPELYAYRYSPMELDRLCFKVPNDPRITPAGRWLRRSTLDELPNFFNVLTGDMALVGPRPEIPEMLRYYEGSDRRKYSVRPGVTGPAQVGGRGRLSFRESVALDIRYVDQRSMLTDFKIVLKTIKGVLKLDGAF